MWIFAKVGKLCRAIALWNKTGIRQTLDIEQAMVGNICRCGTISELEVH